jgi:hypothetical protein
MLVHIKDVFTAQITIRSTIMVFVRLAAQKAVRGASHVSTKEYAQNATSIMF